MLHFSKLTYRHIQREAKRIRKFLGNLNILETPKLTAKREVLEAYIAAWNKTKAEEMKEYAKLIRKLRGKREPIPA